MVIPGGVFFIFSKFSIWGPGEGPKYGHRDQIFKKIFFCYFCELGDPEPENTKKKIFPLSMPPPRPPLAPRTKFSEKFCVCYFCELGDSEPEN